MGRQPLSAGNGVPRHRAQPVRPRADQERERAAGARARGRDRGVVGLGHRRRVGRLTSVRVAPDRGHEGAGAQARFGRQGAVCRRRRRRGRGHEPRRRRGRDGAGRGRLRRAAGRGGGRGSARRRRAARPRRARHEPLLRLEARGRRRRPAVLGGRRDGQRALSPEPADPERDRASRGVRHADPGERASSRSGRRRRCRTSHA